MTIPAQTERKRQYTEIDIRVEDPSLYTPDPLMKARWQSLEFVCNLPVIKAKLNVDSCEEDVRLMVDSGELMLLS